MKSLDLQIAEEITGGNWTTKPTVSEVAGLCHDSRMLQPGEIFVAINAKRDGHDYVATASQAGAVAAIVERRLSVNLPQLVVPNSIEALGALARYVRRKQQIIVTAITGSCGKTTVRGMLASILIAATDQRSVLASYGNWNNRIGMPLCLLKLEDNHRYAVLETGMNHTGELAELAKIAEPDLSIVTNVGGAHMGNFASINQIANAKAELITGTKLSGYCVLNHDDKYYQLCLTAAEARRIFSFSPKGDKAANVIAIGDKQNFEIHHTEFEEPLSINLQVHGEHNQANALAAATAALALGIDYDSITKGLANFTGIPSRLQLHKLVDKALIDDTYNASPESVKVALEVLAQRPEKRKILVLGELLELGDDSVKQHELLGKHIANLGLDVVFTFGQAAAIIADTCKGKHFVNKQELVAATLTEFKSDVALLVKGSRGSQMEIIVNALLGANS